MKKIIGFIFGFSIAFSSFAGPGIALAATTIATHSLEYASNGTRVSFTIYTTDVVSTKVVVTCSGAKNFSVKDTGIQLTDKKGWTAYCSGLKPKTSYTYTISAADGKSFPSVKDNFTTPPAAEVLPESYLLQSVPETQKESEGKYSSFVAIQVTNPVTSRNYRQRLGLLQGTGSCAFLADRIGYDKSTTDTSTAVTMTWRNLSPGTYCFGLEKQNAYPDNTYTAVAPYLGEFKVGDTPIGTNTTTGPQPNENGCISTGTNEYCPLAILPGIGEAGTGKISFTECYIDGVKVTDKSGFGCYLNNFIRIIIALVGVLSIVMVIVGGIEYWSTTSGAEKGTAKGRILAALLGIVLALGSYVILRTINPKLVELEVTVPSGLGELGFTPDEKPGTTYTSTTLNGKTVNQVGALCSQTKGLVSVKILNAGSLTATDFAMPITFGGVWPSDEGKQITINSQIFTGSTTTGTITILPGNERTLLKSNGLLFNAPNPTTAGSEGVTSVYGLPQRSIDGLIKLKKACNCELIITGGTECWLHKTHGPGKQPVDLRKTASLSSFIYDTKNTTKSGKNYTWGTTVFFDEDAKHFHVISW